MSRTQYFSKVTSPEFLEVCTMLFDVYGTRDANVTPEGATQNSATVNARTPHTVSALITTFLVLDAPANFLPLKMGEQEKKVLLEMEDIGMQWSSLWRNCNDEPFKHVASLQESLQSAMEQYQQLQSGIANVLNSITNAQKTAVSECMHDLQTFSPDYLNPRKAELFTELQTLYSELGCTELVLLSFNTSEQQFQIPRMKNVVDLVSPFQNSHSWELLWTPGLAMNAKIQNPSFTINLQEPYFHTDRFTQNVRTKLWECFWGMVQEQSDKTASGNHQLLMRALCDIVCDVIYLSCAMKLPQLQNVLQLHPDKIAQDTYNGKLTNSFLLETLCLLSASVCDALGADESEKVRKANCLVFPTFNEYFATDFGMWCIAGNARVQSK